MPVVFAGVSPHPPIMVPAVGGKESDVVKKSKLAMLELGRRIKESGAQVLIMISPHGPVFSDGIAVNMNPVLTGDLAQFNAKEVTFKLENDLDLADSIIEQANSFGINTVGLTAQEAREYGVRLELDHGLTVPLHFISEAGVDLPLVVIYMGFLSYEELYKFGMAVKNAVGQSDKKAAVIASGDMSHRLIRKAPAGYDPRGLEFDHEMVRLLENGDVLGLLNIDRELTERAGECGLRPVIMMLGSLDGRQVESEVLSYEGPFGVGYIVAALKPCSDDERFCYGKKIEENQRLKSEQRKKNEGYLPSIARMALEQYARGKRLKISLKDIPDEFRRKAGVFVSLKKNGQLRGCIGTVMPQYGNIVEEIIQNAVSAGHRDPRFNPLDKEELDELDISVDVLGAPESIDSKDKLDTIRYGVIVKAGRKQGLLLPNLEGVDTVEEQIRIACEKAGIRPGEDFKLQRFEVVRYT